MRACVVAAVVICIAGSTVPGQGLRQDLQEKVEAVKNVAARNQAALRQYSWVSHTEVSLNGQVKKTRDELCRYGPDGQVQKTPLSSAAPQQEARGIRKRIIEKKTNELEDYIERVVALMHSYIPPSPQMIEQSFTAGNASLGQAVPGAVQLELRNYVKPGDAVAFSFNTPAKALRMVNVNSYLDNPKDVVTLAVAFQTLPGGINYPASITLTANAKKLKIQVQNTNYQKVVD